VNDVIAADGDLVIRRMRDHVEDYERIVAWRNRPHVREWWDPDDPPLTLEAAIEELRAETQPSHPTAACIIEVSGTPAGYIQFYPWDGEQAYLGEVGITLPSGAWGLDIFIGEAALIDQGIGSRTVRLLSDHLFSDFAAYVRAGMRPVERFLDTDLRNGQRVESMLMIRDRPGGTADER
jgi:RimJ/RimL family protein N-acetyltransferase